MKINLSEENSKGILSGAKWLTNAGQNYFTSLNDNQASNAKPTGSIKKIVNTILLVPIIVPTALTVLSFGFVILLLNAVSAQKNHSELSKIAKGTARLLIYIAAAALLITCVILNLVISLVPFLIFLAINKDIFNQNGQDIESNQGPNEVNKVKINTNEEYTERIAEEVGKLESDQQQQDDCAGQYTSIQSSACKWRSALHNRPDVAVISRVVEGEQAVDQTVIAKHINSVIYRDGKAMIRTAETESSVTMKGIIVGDLCDQEKGFATGFSFQCNLLEGDGIDFQFGMNIRTGDTQQEATQALMRSESARILSGDGRLSIEHHGSSRKK